MYIYRLNMSYENKNLEDGLGWETEYLTSEKHYSKFEFQELCVEAFKKCEEESEDICMWSIEKILKDEYGFKRLKPVAEFDFAEEDCIN